MLKQLLAKYEQQIITGMFRKYNGSSEKTLTALSISRMTLRARLLQYGLIEHVNQEGRTVSMLGANFYDGHNQAKEIGELGACSECGIQTFNREIR